MFGRIADLASL